MRLAKTLVLLTFAAVVAMAWAAPSQAGDWFCRRKVTAHDLYKTPPVPETLGTKSDYIWRMQERNAEASDFVVHQHEFEYNKTRMNMAGEDHVRQIAARLLSGQDFPVIVERGLTGIREDSEFKFPVNPDPKLDLERRALLVQSLVAMGVQDAEDRVLVAPAYVPGMKATEAIRSYYNGMSGSGYGGSGYGGGGYGGGGFGGGSFGPFGSFGGGASFGGGR